MKVYKKESPGKLIQFSYYYNFFNPSTFSNQGTSVRPQVHFAKPRTKFFAKPNILLNQVHTFC